METPSIDRIDQIDAMRMGVDYRFPIKIRNFTILLRPLAVMETVQVASDVQEALNGLPKSMINQITEHTVLAKKTLIQASTTDFDVKDPKISDYVLDRMTNDEIHYAFKQYVAGCDRVNPALEKMDKKELEEIVALLKKSQEPERSLALTELSFSHLVSLVAHFLPTEE
jgi:hypothetical protein